MKEEFIQIKNFIKENYKLNRAPVCNDINFFTEKIKKKLPNGQIIKGLSGEECFTWTIPEAWNVKKATLKDSKGNTIIDFKNNPLHLIQYSDSFTGELTFEELEKHLYFSKESPDDIPFIYRKQYYFKKEYSWGIALPFNVFKSLSRDEKFVVDIDVEFKKMDMYIFDYLLPGESSETIFLAAHSCHPAQVNDGIAGIGILIELFKWLEKLEKRKYTYRMIIGPEYYAAALFLKKAEKIKDLKFGFFLDMMVHDGTMGMSSSFEKDTIVDFVSEACLKKTFPKFKKYDYRGLWGNDEMFYDGPDFKIPTIGLGRSDFKNYHLSSDNMDTVKEKSVLESIELLKTIILAFEGERTIKRNYKGPLYLNRYGLYIDPKINPKGYQDLQKIQYYMDGKKSTLEIAKKFGIDPFFVNEFALELINKKLANEI